MVSKLAWLQRERHSEIVIAGLVLSWVACWLCYRSLQLYLTVVLTIT